MATNFPASIDDGTTLPNPSAVNKTNNPSHSAQHSNENDAIKAVESKLGTGASTPSNNTLLIGDGAGTSTWASVTSAQLAARITDETGSGSAVFATSPTLVTPSVNTINEASAGNGVTIDSLNIKDGKLNTNDSVVTSNITDSAITPAKLQSGAGTSWAWQSWTPTFTILTVGNGTVAASYTQTGKTVQFQVIVTFGSTTSMATGSPTFTLPVSASGFASGAGKVVPLGLSMAYDTSATAYYALTAYIENSTTVGTIKRPSSDPQQYAAVTASLPFTWATGDVLSIRGSYEVA